MNTYIAILRGINVSGQKIIKMETLKSIFEGLQFDHVHTYIQSGNIIFSAHENDTKGLEVIISSKIEAVFGFRVPVIVLTKNKLEAIIATNPFGDDKSKDPSALHITFLANKPADDAREQIIEKKQAQEELVITDEVVYLYCPNGYGKTKLNNTFIESKLNVIATTRNWKTCKELFKIACSVR